MRVHYLMLILLLIISLTATSYNRVDIVRHVNYDEVKERQTPILLLFKLIFYKLLISEEGIVGNLTLVRSILREVPIPFSLKVRLDAFLDYMNSFNETCMKIEVKLNVIEGLIKEGNISQAKEHCNEISPLFDKATLTLIKIEIVLDDIYRTYPAVKRIVEPRIDYLRERLEKLRSRYRGILSEIEALVQEYGARINTLIHATLTPPIAHPGDDIRIHGRLSTEHDEPIPYSYLRIELKGCFRSLVKTDQHGYFKLAFKAPLLPGNYSVVIKYVPRNLTYKSSYTLVRFKVIPFKSSIRIVSYTKTLYPRERLLVKGVIESNSSIVEGTIVLSTRYAVSRTSIDNPSFIAHLTLPYNVQEGTYKVRVIFMPRVSFLEPSESEVMILVKEPPYELKLETAHSAFLISIIPVTIQVSSASEVESDLTLIMRLTTMSGHAISSRTVTVKTNRTYQLTLPYPLSLVTGYYKVEVVAIPKNPLVKYTKCVSSLYIVNFQALLTASVLFTIIVLLTTRVLRTGAREIPKRPAVIREPIEVEAISEEVKELPEMLHKPGTLRRMLNLLEALLARTLNIRLTPSKTHREFSKEVRERNAIIGSLLMGIVVIFEKVYYGLKKVRVSEVFTLRLAYEKILSILGVKK